MIMKNLLLLSILITVSSVFAQNKTITGNGKITNKSFDLSNFKSVGSSISGKITINKSNNYHVNLTCDENLIDYIEVYIKENTLKLEYKKGYSIKSKPVEINIEMPELERISSAGSADIEVLGSFNNNEFKISSAGSGDISVHSINAEKLNCSSAGSGNIELKSGKVKNLDISSAGSGDIQTNKIKAENVKVSSAGSGNVVCNASSNLKISSAGSGNISYSGEAKVSSSRVGSGSVKKL